MDRRVDDLVEATEDLVGRIQSSTEITQDLVNTVSSFLDNMLASLVNSSRYSIVQIALHAYLVTQSQ
jgi:hypothetical protein